MKTTRILYATRSMGRVENIEEQGAVQVPPPKRPVGPFLIYYKKQLELMKSKGIVDKISTTVKKEIREKWMNLDEDSKLEYKKEARENSEKYANLSHNIPRKARKVSLYTRCAPNRVHLMVSNLNERQRFVIREMGFGSMLDLRSIQLNRDFCKWLVEHFDHNSCALDICGRRLPISTKDVEFILGVKSSGVDVSIVASAEEINHICQQHGLNVVGDIPINLLEGKLKEMKTSGKEFVGCFVLFVLGTLLCPTSKPYIKRSFISILLNIDEFKSLNWAKLVLDFLIRGVCKYKEKNRVGVSGCLLFLMLFYFEHVNVETNIEHVSKRPQPRICYWGKKEVNQRMLKLHSIGSFDSPKLFVTQMDGGHETENIPLQKQDINESHAMPSQHEDKPNMMLKKK
ncbi:hypothetical protein CMV_020086 [Castanea mollissima]|uniref:HMG box domain-containing protein n=1 Tax=Castanea mollissima TaxID=60419 RepID=A0A8J4QZJ5_9ROSI|nr:hypothetical protein CMV_020086 [Castanea mollissima]